VPAPSSTHIPLRSMARAGGSSQNLRAFIRGNAISGAAIIIGMSQLPKPPISTGITRKKIIMKAWAVTIELYSWGSFRNDPPGCINSRRIRTLRDVPIVPAHNPRMKYIVPIRLWLEVYIQSTD